MRGHDPLRLAQEVTCEAGDVRGAIAIWTEECVLLYQHSSQTLKQPPLFVSRFN